jgi:hypothetical protein
MGKAHILKNKDENCWYGIVKYDNEDNGMLIGATPVLEMANSIAEMYSKTMDGEFYVVYLPLEDIDGNKYFLVE